MSSVKKAPNKGLICPNMFYKANRRVIEKSIKPSLYIITQSCEEVHLNQNN